MLLSVGFVLCVVCGALFLLSLCFVLCCVLCVLFDIVCCLMWFVG